jgi:uncharacterized protein YndB with AHSA1/START domain
MNVEKQGDRISAEVEIAAAPNVVFAALVEPEQLMAWWGSPETYRTSKWQVDPRSGGKWSCEAQSAKDGRVTTIHGVYEEFDPPRVLAYTWNPSWEQMAVTHVRITLEPTAIGTRLRLVHFGFGTYEKAAEEHTKGWARVLGMLESYCRTKSTGKGQ